MSTKRAFRLWKDILLKQESRLATCTQQPSVFQLSQRFQKPNSEFLLTHSLMFRYSVFVVVAINKQIESFNQVNIFTWVAHDIKQNSCVFVFSLQIESCEVFKRLTFEFNIRLLSIVYLIAEIFVGEDKRMEHAAFDIGRESLFEVFPIK